VETIVEKKCNKGVTGEEVVIENAQSGSWDSRNKSQMGGGAAV